MREKQTECRRCGLCCTKGGPALHSQDLHLVRKKIIPRTSLITVRKGELVHKPFAKEPQAASCELIKISGSGRSWQCLYLDSDKKGCKIYQNRPIACSALKCWDTAEIENLVEKDTLTRFDIIEDDEPMLLYVQEHERDCPCPDMFELANTIKTGVYPGVEPFQDLANRDIQLRNRVVKAMSISVAEELFYFGRPIFQLLQQLGVGVVEVQKELKLQWPQKKN